MKHKDIYIDEIAENHGRLLEYVCDKGIDVADFSHKYMESKLKESIDSRSAYYCTMWFDDQYEILCKNTAFKKSKTELNGWLCQWVGEFYSIIGCKTGLSSKELNRILPFDKIYRMAEPLHDIDIDLATDRVIKSLKKEAKIQKEGKRQ